MTELVKNLFEYHLPVFVVRLLEMAYESLESSALCVAYCHVALCADRCGTTYVGVGRERAVQVEFFLGDIQGRAADDGPVQEVQRVAVTGKRAAIQTARVMPTPDLRTRCSRPC